MKCPHCLVSFHDSWDGLSLGSDRKSGWMVTRTICPTCGNAIVMFGLSEQTYRFGTQLGTIQPIHAFLIYPKAPARAPLPPEVPPKFTSDYKEACLVLADSPKASAALSRRCLQNFLRDHVGVKHGNLDNEIQQVLDSGKLPTYLAEAIDAVRVEGNFAAHPIKSTNTGEIIDVVPGEAEWLLDTLDGLFDFYFVQPATLQKKRKALNAKLADAKKPPLK
jgi:Domain of unknown function (DUF4145)